MSDNSKKKNEKYNKIYEHSIIYYMLLPELMYNYAVYLFRLNVRFIFLKTICNATISSLVL